MWFPTKAAMDRAALLRILERHETQVRGSNDGLNAGCTNPGEELDLTMVYSMMTDCHRQLVTVSRGVWALVAAVLLVAWRLVS